MHKLAVITTHPIQYNAPVFRILAQRKRLDIQVFYTKRQELVAFDRAFQQEIHWDIPLLEGYLYQFHDASTKAGYQKLVKAILEYHPTGLLVFGWNPPGHLRLMRRFRGRLKILFRGDSTLLNEVSGIKQLFRRIFLKWVYRYLDFAFYVGSANKHYFSKHGLKAHQLIYAPHAIDNERFLGDFDGFEEKAEQWKAELGITSKDFVVLFAGKLEPIKNPILLLKAVQRFNQKHSGQEMKLIFVGNGILLDKLTSEARGDKNVLFLGFQNQSQMPVVYRLGNLYCLPSISETWGLGVNEALACGRPALVSDKVGCSLDIVIDKHYGYIFKQNDLGSLEAALTSMYQHGEFSRNGLQKHIQKWNFLSIVESIEKTLEQ